MRIRAILIPVAVLAAMAGAGWGLQVLSSWFDGTSHVMPATARSETPADRLAKDAPHPRSFAEVRRSAGDPVAQTTPTTPATVGAATGEPKIALDGVVIVTDAKGTRHDTEDGTLVPAFYDAPREVDGRRTRTWQNAPAVAVSQGRFRVEARADRQFGATQLTVGGRPAVIDGDPVDVVAGHTLTIHAHWVEVVSLRVVDDATHLDLADVTVVRRERRSFNHTDHPGAPASSVPVVAHATSPLQLSPPANSSGARVEETFWVSAPGHAWRAIDVDFKDLADRTLELHPAATLVVDLQGELPDGCDAPGASATPADEAAVPQLRLHRLSGTSSFDDVESEALEQFAGTPPESFPGGKKPTVEEFKQVLEQMRAGFEFELAVGELLVEQPAKLGVTQLDAVAAGEVIVSVEVGRGVEPPLVVAKGSVELVAGETARVTLRVTPPKTPDRACGVTVDLLSDGARVAWTEPLAASVELEAVDGKGKVAWKVLRDAHPVVAVTTPGRYRLKLPAIPGYVAVQAIEIDVPAGQFVTKQIELRRSR